MGEAARSSMGDRARVVPYNRPQLFVICILHPEMGPVFGRIWVSRTARGWWQTEWDIGTIDRDARLSDDWFCQEQYEHRFVEAVQTALNKHGSSPFELPGATSRWGVARGMHHRNALALAGRLVALWEEILLEWGTRRGK